jgi:predicted sugar kinase
MEGKIMNKRDKQGWLGLSAQIGLTVGLLALTTTRALAVPVVYEVAFTATSGGQFGIGAPLTLTGTFNVDSAFLQQADGSVYAGGDRWVMGSGEQL